MKGFRIALGVALVLAASCWWAMQAVAADLVHAALLAEASGDAESRRQLLQEAVKASPDAPLAHWSLGEVRQDGRWLSLENAQEQAASDRRLAEYRSQRDRLGGSPAGQLTLAVWCREHGMPAESRAHWMQVLMAQPENEEAQKALGARWRQGQLLTDAQLKQMKKLEDHYGYVSTSPPQLANRWTAPVAQWRRELKQGDENAKESLRREVLASKRAEDLHDLGSVIIQGSLRKTDPRGFRLVSFALVDALDYCGEPWAVTQLARLAVEHPTIEVHDAAADALKSRPKMSYVPWMLSQMQTPIYASISVSRSPGEVGVVIHQTLERDGANATYRDIRQQYYHVGTPWIVFRPSWRSYATNIPQVIHDSCRGAENYAAATEDQVERVNAAIADNNERIQYALTRATGEKMITDSSAWQRWWTKYYCNYYELGPTLPDESAANSSISRSPYDYEQPKPGETKPVIEQRLVFGVPATVLWRVATGPYGSCFPWNTKVWTQTGPVDINQIKPGDRVLSQQPSTGELSYEVVVQVTRRNPTSMVEIGLGDETIRATRGHPFWVSGQGWKMAKELTVGMWLHTIDGPIQIDRIEDVAAAGPWLEQIDGKPGDDLSYNLVLEERHNYFVGRQKVLAHDNTLYPLDGPVPSVSGLGSP